MLDRITCRVESVLSMNPRKTFGFILSYHMTRSIFSFPKKIEKVIFICLEEEISTENLLCMIDQKKGEFLEWLTEDGVIV